MPGRNHAGPAAALVDTNVWVYAHLTGWVIGPQGMAEWQLGGD